MSSAAEPQVYPNLEPLHAISRRLVDRCEALLRGEKPPPFDAAAETRAELLRQARILIPLYRDSGRVEEAVFWAHFVADFAREPAKRRRRR